MIEHELNARTLANSEVGKRFVVHPSFHRLVAPDNSLVIGPRGSGKTTMLRMLTPEALHFWEPNDREEVKIKENITFNGLYVPMSRIFQDDLEIRYSQSALKIEDKDNLVFKIYYLNIIESILEMVYFFVENRKFDKKKELEASQLLKEVLELDIPFCYKISTLIRAVSRLKLQTRNFLSYSKRFKEEVSYKGSVISNIEPVLRAVNEIFDFNPAQKYALCLDELDIYASDFTAEMIRNLRGQTTNVILKLSLAPLHHVKVSKFMDPPQRIHDFNKIYLWPNPESSENNRLEEEKRYLEFSEKLATQTISNLANTVVDLKDVLGEFSYKKIFEYLKSSETEGNIFKPLNLEKLNDKQIENYVFLKLAERDLSFKNYITLKRGVDLKDLKKAGRRKSSAVIRKLKQVVFNRIIISKFVDGKSLLVTSRLPVQYHGRKMILKAMDGNPRYLKKLMEFLANDIDIVDSKIQEISITNQAKALKRVKDLFVQRIEAIPTNSNEINYNAASLIELIGDYLSRKQNLESTWDSSVIPSYIRIPNSRVINNYEDAFVKAINHGALMIIGENHIKNLNSIRLLEVRLNNLLHVEYKLPLRKYYPASFRDVIEDPSSGKYAKNYKLDL